MLLQNKGKGRKNLSSGFHAGEESKRHLVEEVHDRRRGNRRIISKVLLSFKSFNRSERQAHTRKRVVHNKEGETRSKETSSVNDLKKKQNRRHT